MDLTPDSSNEIETAPDDLVLRSRRITMSDGRYMIFFTFETASDKQSAAAESDV